jgi:glycosyltransferase involved in cell wall biosynthesis
MKHILLLSLYPLNEVGGGERYTLDTFRSIILCGDQCSAYAVTTCLPPRQQFTERMATQFAKVLPGTRPTFGESIALRDLLLDVARYDGVVVHQYLSNDLIFDIVASVASDQSLILTNLGHEPLTEQFKACFQPSPCCWFVEISNFSATRASKFSKQSLSVSAGIWRDDIMPSADQERPFAGRLCSVGRVLPHKGLEVTINAVPSDCSLTIAGPNRQDPRYVTFLRSLCRGRQVEFLGQVSEEKKRAIIGDSDLLIASSLHRLYDGRVIPQPELLGLVIFEALAQNTMPITSSVPSFREVMSALGLCDFVYQEGDIASLQERISGYRAIPSDELAGRIDQARQRMIDCYLWDDFWTRIKQRVPID